MTRQPPANPTRNGAMHYMHWLAKTVDAILIYLAGAFTFWVYFGYPIWQWERYQWMTTLSSLAAVYLFSAGGVYRSWRGALRGSLFLRLTPTSPPSLSPTSTSPKRATISRACGSASG